MVNSVLCSARLNALQRFATLNKRSRTDLTQQKDSSPNCQRSVCSPQHHICDVLGHVVLESYFSSSSGSKQFFHTWMPTIRCQFDGLLLAGRGRYRCTKGTATPAGHVFNKKFRITKFAVFWRATKRLSRHRNMLTAKFLELFICPWTDFIVVTDQLLEILLTRIG